MTGMADEPQTQTATTLCVSSFALTPQEAADRLLRRALDEVLKAYGDSKLAAQAILRVIGQLP